MAEKLTKAQRQNKDVKVGTVRKGAAGNKYNKWDGKRWVPVAAARTSAGSGQKATVVSKPVPKTSGTKPRVAGSIAAKQPRQKPAGRRTSKVAVTTYKAKRTARQTRKNVENVASKVPSQARRFLSDIWYQ